MNKKAYKTPSTMTILLRQQVTLLAGSDGLEAVRDGYSETTPETWD